MRAARLRRFETALPSRCSTSCLNVSDATEPTLEPTPEKTDVLLQKCLKSLAGLEAPSEPRLGKDGAHRSPVPKCKPTHGREVYDAFDFYGRLVALAEHSKYQRISQAGHIWKILETPSGHRQTCCRHSARAVSPALRTVVLHPRAGADVLAELPEARSLRKVFWCPSLTGKMLR